MKEIQTVRKTFGFLDKFPLGTFVLRKDFVVLYWNTCLEVWTGVLENNIVGTNIIDQFPRLGKPKFMDRFADIFEGGPPTTFSSELHNYILPSPLPNGEFRIQHTTVISLPALHGTGFYALFVIQDVTDLTHSIQNYRGMRDQAWEEIKRREVAEKKLKDHSLNLEKMVEERTSELRTALHDLQETQSQLLQSEKMASIGQLAAGVAHEINNPVGFVKSNLGTMDEYREDLIGLLNKYGTLEATLGKEVEISGNRAIHKALEDIRKVKDEIDLDFILDDYQKVIEESLEGMARVAKIVSDLKDFAHVDKAELEHADINKGIESTLNIVWNELKYKAEVVKDFGDIPLVKCYPQRLNQVFMNILVNAAQAIEAKGELRIQTRLHDGYAEIRISDTGMGIPKEILPKIFDPFFTTKDIGKGTGLGLNVAYNIIQKRKGTIDVESEVGKGTTFTIRIPTGETSA